MDLRNYWRVLANPDADSGDWNFYSNGWLSLKNGCKTTVYKANGCEFISGKISNIVTLANGFIAICEEISKKEEWTVYSEACVPVMILNREIKVLHNGLLVFTTPDGGTSVVSVDNPKESVFLGYQVRKVCDAPFGVFAYAKYVRGNIYWYMGRIVNGKLVKKELLSGVHNLFFFENGSYATYGKGDMVWVYNRSGQKIFACNTKKTKFDKVGNNYFVAYNGMRYQGIYSAEDGKLVWSDNEVQHYFANGAFYIPNEGLSFDNDKGFVRQIYDVVAFGGSLVAFMYRNQRYVIDTAMPVEKLRQIILSELCNLTEAESYYGAYLTSLLSQCYTL